MRFRNSIEIKEPSDFELVAEDLLNDFLDTFPDVKGLTRPVESDDLEEFSDDCTPSYMFTDKGVNLYERAVKRLVRLGEKIFPDEELDIRSSNLIEP